MTPDIKQLLDQQISRVANEVDGTVGADKILLASISVKNNADYVKVTSLDPAVSNYHSYIDSTDDLPDALDVGDGAVIFVNDLKVPVLSVNGRWVTLNQPGGESVVISGPARPENKIYTWGNQGESGGGTWKDLLARCVPQNPNYVGPPDSYYDYNNPGEIVSGFTDWCKLATGSGYNVAAIRKNGTLWMWGLNIGYSLGNGNSDTQSSPVQVLGGFTDWCDVSTAWRLTAGIRTNGTMWTWGLYDTPESTSSPTQFGTNTNWCKVVLGTPGINAALKKDGTAWSWGGVKVLIDVADGIYSTGILSSPVQITHSSLTNVWKDIDLGCGFAIGIDNNGCMWSWGCCNFCGLFGNGTELDGGATYLGRTPNQVLGGFSDWCAVSIAKTWGSVYAPIHAAAIRENGTLWAWGNNWYGQLGDGTTTDRCSPVEVLGGFSDWCMVNAGESCFSVALRANGTAWAWGSNNGLTVNPTYCVDTCSPVQVQGCYNDWTSVTAGWKFVAGIRSTTP